MIAQVAAPAWGPPVGAWPWFLVSIAVLALGPVVLWVARRWPALLRGLDGFVLASVGGIVVADVLPEALQRGGVLALLLVAAGLMGPGWLETRLQRAATAVHTLALVMGVLGLALHAALDGAALAGASDAQAQGLATAVLLHRLPEGLTIWWLLAPTQGPRIAALVLLGVAAATATGFGLAAAASGIAETGPLAWVQALVAGSLLHVVFHRTQHVDAAPQTATPGRQWAGGVGALLGLGLLVVVLRHHDAADGHAHQGEVFWELARESALALVIAYAAAGLVQSLLPQASLRWLARGSRLGQAVRGTAFGLPLPICSCGVVPVYRSLALAGTPTAAGIAFLVATPELGLDAVLLSFPLLGAQLAGVRLAAAALVAVVVGISLDWALQRGWTGPALRTEPPKLPDHPTSPGSWTARTLSGLRIGFGDMVDHTGPWVVVGLGVATLGQPLLAGGDMARWPAGLDVPIFALLGMPMYVCASGATPLAAVLIAGGVSPGAGLAFLLTGPATNVSTFGVLAQLHGRRFALGFAGCTAVASIALGWATNLLLQGYRVPALGGPDHEHHGWVDEAALVALVALLVASLLRQGPRGFLGQVLDVARVGHDHDHGTGDHTGHSHAHSPGDHHGHAHAHDHAGHGQPGTGGALGIGPAGAADADACDCGHDHGVGAGAKPLRVKLPPKPAG